MEKVCILGLGYIGLPTAAMFATHGIKVKGVDVRKDVCDIINEGRIHIEEPYLADLVKQAVLKGMITASTEIEPTEAYIIAVPTPITKDKKADLSYVISAGEKIAEVLKKGDLIILESTVSPRCTIDVLRPTLEKSGLKAGKDFYLAHCPERVLPGQIIYELEHNNRVIGGFDIESAERARDLYSAFVKGEIYLTDTVTAELCKLMENTYRDVNIALANELAKICEKMGSSAWDVIKYANKHPRVNLHMPGPGVGGHCLAVDPWFVIEAAPDTANIIELSRKTNDSMPEYLYNRIRKMVKPGEKIVVLGCTYKANVDDMRESPIMHLADKLKNEHELFIIDPYIKEYDTNIYEGCNNADLVVLGVNHKQFDHINFDVLSKVVRQKKIVDTRNYFNEGRLKELGFEIYCIGKSN
ncbi:MAG: nucleotide sugar dehydrogenase [Bacillota bacterium]